MYPNFSIANQVYELQDGINKINSFVGKELHQSFSDIIHCIINTYSIINEAESRQDLLVQVKKIGGVQEIKFLDSGIYIFVDQFLLLLDAQAISAIEPFELLDRVYIHSDRNTFVIKLFRYRFSSNFLDSDYTLGITRHGHDSSAALIDNKSGRVMAFEREERPLRIKPAFDFPVQAIRDVLKIANIQLSQIKAISVGHGIHWFEDTPSSDSPALNCFQGLGEGFLKKDFGSRFHRNYVSKRIREALPDIDLETVPVFFVRHHIAHAASMPIQPNQTESKNLFLVMDGRGEWDTITAWLMENGDLKNILHIGMPNTLGDMYNMLGRFMGWREFGFEGQIMGLAPYGKPQNPHEEQIYEVFAQAFKDFVQLPLDTLQFFLNHKYFFGSFRSDYLEKTSGWVTPLTPSDYFLDLLSSYVKPLPEGVQIDPFNPEHRAICVLAYALQTRTCEVILSLVEQLKNRYPQVERLYLSGGVALNVTTNGEIIQRGFFTNENLITTPVPGDDGLSIGAALYLVRYFARNNYSHQPYRSALLGREYKTMDVHQALDRFKLSSGEDYREFPDFDNLVETTVELIQEGHGVAWFQGREEAGPRALGARSILFSLTDPNSNLLANKSKRRQPWRPSAISILEEDVKEALRHCSQAPYMSIAFMPESEFNEKLKSGLHPADNSTRPQTVNRDDTPHLYQLLTALKIRTGLGAILNTSYNRGEPIVHYPDDAFNTLYYLDGVEYLAISNILVRKGNLRPCIISASDEPQLREYYKEFRRSGNARDFIGHLLSFPISSHHVQIVVDQYHKMPMFKEGFDIKVLVNVLEQYFIHKNVSPPADWTIEPANTPYETVLLRLLDGFKRKI